MIAPHPIYEALGTGSLARLHAYRGLFRRHLAQTELDAIRDALNQEMVIGREDFKNRMEQILERQIRPGKPGRPSAEERSARDGSSEHIRKN